MSFIFSCGRVLRNRLASCVYVFISLSLSLVFFFFPLFPFWGSRERMEEEKSGGGAAAVVAAVVG